MPHYYSYSSFLKKKFGEPVAKIPVNAGFSCPNRDGTKGLLGCAFCDNRAFSPVAEAGESPLAQLRSSAGRLSKRYKKFLAYLQPYSNTHGTVGRLRAAYEPLLQEPGVVGLCIGTRPDCLGHDICEYLGRLAQRTYVSVELGLQSSHDATLAALNRGHTFADFTAAVARLAGLGIDTAVHLILGLPGESPEMMFETADRVAALPLGGVKFHQLMILNGTPLARRYAEGTAQALTLEKYAPLLCGCIGRLRPDQCVHRIVSDTREEGRLIAPLWSGRKRQSLQFLHRYMEEHGLVQGARRGAPLCAPA